MMNPCEMISMVEVEMAWNHKSVDMLEINLAVDQDHRDPRNHEK